MANSKGGRRPPGGPGQTRVFPPPRDFSSLSIRDLMEAREHYHVHLSNIESVVGTAIGRYRIHESDWYADHPPSTPRGKPKPKEPRTFENTVVRPWSWPCVLVLVRQWLPHGAPGQTPIPKQLYLPDGRIIPTCVMLAPPDDDAAPDALTIGYSSGLIGGGYSCTRTTQGITRSGTLGCLVEREGTYYALTNRHVAGPDNGVVDAIVRGERVRVGLSDPRMVNRVSMQSVFPDWPGANTFVNIDAGLVMIDDITQWTSQVFGIGEIAEPFDATPASLTLDIIGCPVRAFGGASGVLEGEIQALFVRYKSQGGTDYVSDLLIGERRRPDKGDRRAGSAPSVTTRPGDSGTLWFYDPPNRPAGDTPSSSVLPPEPAPERGRRARRLMPIAMQWGAQRVRLDSGATASHALATFVSTVCRVLDIEIVHGYGTGHDEYWGKIGHFSIGWKACDFVDDKAYPGLARLMNKNQPNIGFDDHRLAEGGAFRTGRGGFVPLADVPDYVWVANPSRQGEGEQHFADIDIVGIDGSPPLLDRCVDDERNISATVWRDYFAGFANKGVGPDEGALPFRVWQIWDEMVAALRAGDLARFVTAAGVVAHYVGDASQPLHCSWLHHGRPPTTRIGNHAFPPRKSDGKGKDKDKDSPYAVFRRSPAAKIHAIYEEQMLEIEPDVALASVDRELRAQGAAKLDIQSGFQAARAVIAIMDASRKRLPPERILAADDPTLTQKQRAARLWKNSEIREATIASLADSTRVLAALWQGAWTAGNGESIPDAKLRRFEESELQAIYTKAAFLPGYTLAELAESGRYEPTSSPTKRVTRTAKPQRGSVKRVSQQPVAPRRLRRKPRSRSGG